MTARNHRPLSHSNPIAWIWRVVIAIATSIEGSAIARLNDFDRASLNHREAQYLAPTTPQIHYNAGLAFMPMGQYEEALTSLNTARDLASTQEDPVLLGEIEFSLTRLQRREGTAEDFGIPVF
ncbi:hypothetical protein E1H12_18425 [Geitlerinema sp. P-1104]|uniref:tetratricopeptide repeat protein n=1 Tax=Geitlerinema sp. P-1104 TaxID=2546230 RepID=UPI0014770DE3|nr:hypothetical protein [Geitlerinema sp. P-1104]NMG60435.1 hypothetical protein [Geitlerinema sp. P-1104]